MLEQFCERDLDDGDNARRGDVDECPALTGVFALKVVVAERRPVIAQPDLGAISRPRSEDAVTAACSHVPEIDAGSRIRLDAQRQRVRSRYPLWESERLTFGGDQFSR